MRINKQVSLKGPAPFCPIDLSDVVVGMGHLGWATPQQDRYEIRRMAWWKWPIWLLGGWFVRWRARNSPGVTRFFEVAHWIEASIDEKGAGRELVLRGNASFRDVRKIDALCQSLAQGRRWLTPDALVGEVKGGGPPEEPGDRQIFDPDPS